MICDYSVTFHVKMFTYIPARAPEVVSARAPEVVSAYFLFTEELAK